ncbi:MAG: energy-coupled thiamine transporter ThiT [Oscillospiraceae bacterium]|nr:energy-coupled thiamine transporter ThiT [Oscillospiraceae bacterium]
MKSKKVLTLVESAVLLGLAFALSFVKIIQMPWGGSVTLLSMLPLAVISIRHGLKWGLSAAFLFSALDFFESLGRVMVWGLTPTVFAGMVFLDYALAYTVIGLAGLFRRKGFEGQCLGVVFAVTLRFVCHFISGIVLWGEYAAYYEWAQDSVPLYSLLYNGAYMFPEIIFTTIGAVILLKVPYIQKLFTQA